MRQRGFTLLELMVVLVIAAILMTVVPPMSAQRAQPGPGRSQGDAPGHRPGGAPLRHQWPQASISHTGLAEDRSAHRGK